MNPLVKQKVRKSPKGICILQYLTIRVVGLHFFKIPAISLGKRHHRPTVAIRIPAGAIFLSW
jgi:hypothetical protein